MRQSSTFLNLAIPGSTHSNQRLFYLLWGLASFGLLAGIPYALALQQGKLQTIHLPLPVPIGISVEFVAQFAILSLLTFIGLRLAESMGLGAPVFADWVEGKSVRLDYRITWLPIIFIGLAVSGLVAFLDQLVLNQLFQNQFQVNSLNLPVTINPPLWKGLLASFYGGFTQEILIRLFLMTLLAWIGNNLLHSLSNIPSSSVIWSANILAALLFGLNHLPSAIALGLPLNAIEIV
ncbi:MAG: type II CAAX prenyl endopeptidase Rce1 family protein [Anaerolineales bacterium]|jgi:hypothetical protein